MTDSVTYPEDLLLPHPLQLILIMIIARRAPSRIWLCLCRDIDIARRLDGGVVAHLKAGFVNTLHDVVPEITTGEKFEKRRIEERRTKKLKVTAGGEGKGKEKGTGMLVAPLGEVATTVELR